MDRVQINGKARVTNGMLVLITVAHESRPDIAIYQDLFDAIGQFEKDSKGEFTYKEIVKRKRVQNAQGSRIYYASQYTVLFLNNYS